MRQDAGSGPILAEPLICTFEVGYLEIIHLLMRPILVGSLVRTFEAPHRAEWPGRAGNDTADQYLAIMLSENLDRRHPLEPAVAWFVSCGKATVRGPKSNQTVSRSEQTQC